MVEQSENGARENAQQQRLLPYDVRYALQYREAKLGTGEILDLARNGFSFEGIYVFLKAAERDPELQRSLLENISGGLEDLPQKDVAHTKDFSRRFIEENISRLPADTSIPAEKLAQYSRQGFDLWEQKMTEKAQEAAKRDNPSFVVGHSMFVGLPAFMRSHADARKPLHILLPSYIKSAERTMSGYIVEPRSVRFLDKGFSRIADSIVMDDTKQTGETERAIATYWSADGRFPLPKFEYIDTA